LVLACGARYLNYEQKTGYNLTSPDKLHLLPDTLREVSGLTSISNSTFACVQDENGILFIYDSQQNKIIRQYQFNLDGDYEGIARVGNDMFVLQSDGIIYQIVNFKSEKFRLISYKTGIPANNNEGLCYDKQNNRLLVACKSKIGTGREFKDRRVIYGFDLEFKKLSEQPVFDFDLREINEFAKSNKISLPVKIKKNGGVTVPTIKFRTSAICIHPVTGKLFLLSALDHMLFMFRMDGTLEHMELLNPDVFNKAEGITFTENGDMLITNEGQNKKPTLLLFVYRK